MAFGLAACGDDATPTPANDTAVGDTVAVPDTNIADVAETPETLDDTTSADLTESDTATEDTTTPMDSTPPSDTAEDTSPPEDTTPEPTLIDPSAAVGALLRVSIGQLTGTVVTFVFINADGGAICEVVSPSILTVTTGNTLNAECDKCLGRWRFELGHQQLTESTSCDPGFLTGPRDVLTRLAPGGDLAPWLNWSLLDIARADTGLPTVFGMTAQQVGASFQDGAGNPSRGLVYINPTALPDAADWVDFAAAPNTGAASALRNIGALTASSAFDDRFLMSGTSAPTSVNLVVGVAIDFGVTTAD